MPPISLFNQKCHAQQTSKNVFLSPRDRLHFCIVFKTYLPQVIHFLMIRLIFSFLFLMSASLVFGQGWERVLSGGGQDEARGIVATPDGGYLLTGIYQGIRGAVVKTDADGFEQWHKYYAGTGGQIFSGNAIATTPDSNILIAGTTRPGQFNPDGNIWLMKTDQFGEKIWEKNFGGSQNDAATTVLVLPDGNFIAAGFVTDAMAMRDFWLAKFDPDGSKIWEKFYGNPDDNEIARQILISKNGNIVVVGEREDGPDTDVCVLRLDSEGEFIWQTDYGFDFVPNSFSTDAGYSIAESEDGGLVVAGKTTSLAGQQGGLLLKISADGNPAPTWFKALPNSVFNSIIPDGTGGFFLAGEKQSSLTNENVYLVRVDDEGDVIWENTVGKSGPDVGLAAVNAKDGGLVVAGRSSLNSLLGDTYIYLVKTKADGKVFTDYIEGHVFHDYNNDCQKTANEPIQTDWIVKIESADFTRYATTDESGFFQSLVDTGLYTVTVLTPNSYWQNCQPSVVVPVFNFYDTISLDLGVKAAKSCPQNRVDVSTPLLRRCAENVYTVRYCNLGTIPSIDTRVEVLVDDFLSVTGSSVPWSSVSGNVFTFNIGFLDAGECGNFDLTAWLNCDSTISGQAHCVRAHIFPDSICKTDPTWDKSFVTVEGKCDSQQVKFSATNRSGFGMTQTLDYVIVEDQIIYRTGQIPTLAPGEETLIFSKIANNQTYRIIADQSPGYPGLSYPTAAVEGCKTDTTSNPISTGFYTMFPEDDADAFVSADCQESNDPNFNPAFLKRGHPKGAEVEHFVNPNTDLEFLIRFVNTGADTVRGVIVRDTLSPWLDPASVVPGGASHDYDFQVYAGGIVQFTLPNQLLLPDGSPASGGTSSSGYVKFRVSQKPDLPCKTTIRNRAAIFFDFNAPAASNETFHTVCQLDSVLTTKSQEIFVPGAAVNFFPNPFTDEATVTIDGVQAKIYTLEIYDALGRQVAHQTKPSPEFRLLSFQFSRGIYFYRLAADGRSVASGKIEKH